MAAQAMFLVVAAVALLGGLGVIAFRQPIHSVLSLVGSMLALAILFLLLSAQFVFVVQIIVYAGAVMVLFLFVVALLGPLKERWTHRLGMHWLVALVAAIAFFVLLLAMLQSVTFRTPQGGDMSIFGTVQSIGAGLFGPYLYPFELTSILLLVAAVGAIYLSRGGRGPRANPPVDRPERVETPPSDTSPSHDREVVAHKEERRG